MQKHHAVIWLDHREARIFFFNRNAFEEVDIRSTAPDTHLHHKAGSLSGKRAPEDHAYFEDIVTAASAADAWLITGPSSAKLELVKHIHLHAPQLVDHIVGIESADHPSDRQIVAHARAYFRHPESVRSTAKK